MTLKLMIPGPIDVEDSVLDSLSQSVEPHYGDTWLPIHHETLDLLKQVFKTEGRIFMMPGSGTVAGDAVTQSMFNVGQKVLVGSNGFFGIRWLQIVEANGLIPVEITAAADEALDPAAFDRALTEDPEIAGVVVVLLETSTALRNPVKEIAEIARKHDKLMIVDGVSGLACTEFEMDAWGIDAAITGSQKGLCSVAGLGIAAVSERAWSVIEQTGDPRSFYLDLRRWQWYVENWGDWHPYPVTMPTSVVLALRTALKSLLEDGLDNRLRRYERVAARLRSGLREIGMNPVVDDSLMTPVLTAAYCPPGITSGELMKYMETEHGIKITGGFGELKQKVVRIGHMGVMVTEEDVDRLLAALRQYIEQHEAQPS